MCGVKYAASETASFILHTQECSYTCLFWKCNEVCVESILPPCQELNTHLGFWPRSSATVTSFRTFYSIIWHYVHCIECVVAGAESSSTLDNSQPVPSTSVNSQPVPSTSVNSQPVPSTSVNSQPVPPSEPLRKRKRCFEQQLLDLHQQTATDVQQLLAVQQQLLTTQQQLLAVRREELELKKEELVMKQIKLIKSGLILTEDGNWVFPSERGEE